MIEYEVKNRFTGKVQFTAKIDCNKDELVSIKLGLAVRWGIKNGAYLRGANLRGAYLSDAYLRGADLRDADLRGADLRGADLRGAYLSGAYLRDAYLRGADLRGADLRQFKHDVWSVCLYAKDEIANLLKSIQEGRIDGSCYEGECCCLCGTLEKGLSKKLNIRDASSPAEQWFSMIKEGDNPSNNFASEMAEKWVKELLDILELEKGNE